MARAFSGSSQYLSRTDPTGIDPSASFSCGLWVYRTDHLDVRGILLVGGPTGASTTARGFSLLSRDSPNSLEVQFAGGEGYSGGTLNDATWHRCGITYSAGGTDLSLIVDGSDVGGADFAAITAMSAGDVIRFGAEGAAFSDGTFKGREAGAFWLQGVVLSAAAMDSYLQDLCALIGAYGPSGTITANALKGLWLFQDSDPGADISGVGNNLTNTGTTDVADPSGVPASCSSGTNIYILDSTASGSNFGQLQIAGSAPSTSTTGTGWTVDTVGSSNYALMAYGSERASTAFGGTAQPAGNPDNSTGDCFRSTNVMTGDFATGVWTITVPVIAVTGASGQDGRVRVRLWKSINATGTTPTEITTGTTVGTTVTNLATGAEQSSVATTASITGFSMTSEYLFVQLAWEITGAAT